jgi:hypothetical protein
MPDEGRTKVSTLIYPIKKEDIDNVALIITSPASKA